LSPERFRCAFELGLRFAAMQARTSIDSIEIVRVLIKLAREPLPSRLRSLQDRAREVKLLVVSVQ
jgi:hypothetical protein